MRTYFDIPTGFAAQANDRRMAWQMIHDKCKELGHHPPLLNEVFPQFSDSIKVKMVSNVLGKDGWARFFCHDES